MSQNKYYSIDKLMNLNTTYAISFGERSRGKTYSALLYGIKTVVNSNYKDQFVYLRRFDKDITVPNCKNLFTAIEENGEITKITNGKWTNIEYRAGCWYFYKIDKKGNKVKSDKAFAYAFALRQFEHFKSLSFPNVRFICFDEFISRIGYLSGEFQIFLNTVSTLVRDRDDVRIVLLGNTVSLDAPYFHSMGIYYKVKEMKVGSTLLFKSENSNRTIAVEYTESAENGKASDVYFDFNDGSASMITTGEWETAKYPLLDHDEKKDIRPKDIRYIFYIQVYDEVFEGNIIIKGYKYFLYIHKPLAKVDLDKLENKKLIYSTDYSTDYNYRRDILKPTDKLTTEITKFFKMENVFYDTNRTGEMIRNYLLLFKTI